MEIMTQEVCDVLALPRTLPLLHNALSKPAQVRPCFDSQSKSCGGACNA